MFDVPDLCFKLEDIFDATHDVAKTTLERLHDVFVHEESPSLGFDSSVLPNPLNHSHASPLCSLPSPSAEHYIDMPI